MRSPIPDSWRTGRFLLGLVDRLRAICRAFRDPDFTGRTLRQVIFGMLGFGTLGAGLFYMIFGNFGLSLELTGTVEVTGIMSEQNGSEAVVAMLDQLPAAACCGHLCAHRADFFSDNL